MKKIPCKDCITYVVCKNQINILSSAPLYRLVDKCSILKTFIYDGFRDSNTNYYNTCEVYGIGKEYLKNIKKVIKYDER